MRFFLAGPARLVIALCAGGLAACDDTIPLPVPDLALGVPSADLATHDLTIAAPPDQASRPDAGAPDADAPRDSGALRITVLDDRNAQPAPARAIITAVAPTPAIRFDIDRVTHVHVNGERGIGLAPGVVGAPEGVLLTAGSGVVTLPPGTYDLFLTRGPEYDADLRRITVDATHDLDVTATLHRSVDTTGWLAADLHVHTGRSYDSQLQVPVRITTEVAVGVELIVTTDHNVLSDLQPDVEIMGYAHLARAIVGDEFNFYEGHGGAYPMPYDAKVPVDGGVWGFKLNWEVVRWIHSADMFNTLHAFPTRPAVTINHPRLPPDLGYFINLKQFGPNGWAPPIALPDAGTFDAIELMNGYMDAPAELAVMMRDWFFLLSSGTRVTALGSSDTHRLRDVKAGFPRSWLRLPTDDVTRVLDSDLADAIKNQRAIASNGPFAVLTVDGAQIGDLVTPRSGAVMVDATVDAPAWIDVDKVRVYLNGQVVKDFAVTPGARPLFHQRFSLPVPAGDGWIVLQASGSKALPTALIGEHEGGAVMPFVVTNPVFLDDGDHVYNPQLPNPDPGPVGPFRYLVGPLGDPLVAPAVNFERQAQPAPEDCEPPLWTVPSSWVNP